MGTQAQNAISKHQVTEWNKSTVADGTYLNDKTITPLRDRDVELAKIIDGLDTKFPNNQDLAGLKISVSENEAKIEAIKDDIGPTSARNLVVSIQSKIENLPKKQSGNVVNVRTDDSALIVRKSDDNNDVYKFESYVFTADDDVDKWERDEELLDVYSKDGVDNLVGINHTTETNHGSTTENTKLSNAGVYTHKVQNSYGPGDGHDYSEIYDFDKNQNLGTLLPDFSNVNSFDKNWYDSDSYPYSENLLVPQVTVRVNTKDIGNKEYNYSTNYKEWPSLGYSIEKSVKENQSGPGIVTDTVIKTARHDSLLLYVNKYQPYHSEYYQHHLGLSYMSDKEIGSDNLIGGLIPLKKWNSNNKAYTTNLESGYYIPLIEVSNNGDDIDKISINDYSYDIDANKTLVQHTTCILPALSYTYSTNCCQYDNARYNSIKHYKPESIENDSELKQYPHIPCDCYSHTEQTDYIDWDSLKEVLEKRSDFSTENTSEDKYTYQKLSTGQYNPLQVGYGISSSSPLRNSFNVLDYLNEANLWYEFTVTNYTCHLKLNMPYLVYYDGTGTTSSNYYASHYYTYIRNNGKDEDISKKNVHVTALAFIKNMPLLKICSDAEWRNVLSGTGQHSVSKQTAPHYCIGQRSVIKSSFYPKQYYPSPSEPIPTIPEIAIPSYYRTVEMTIPSLTVTLSTGTTTTTATAKNVYTTGTIYDKNTVSSSVISDKEMTSRIETNNICCTNYATCIANPPALDIAHQYNFDKNEIKSESFYIMDNVLYCNFDLSMINDAIGYKGSFAEGTNEIVYGRIVIDTTWPLYKTN